MTTHFTVNDKRVVDGRLTIPFYGTWTADLVLAGAEVIEGEVTIVLGDIELKGTAKRGAPFAGAASVRCVGGGGGWNQEITSKGYSHVAGVKMSSALKDAARSAGEQIEVGSDRTLGTSYVRRKDKASRVLKHLLAGRWWMDLEGITQTEDRDDAVISSLYTVLSFTGALGRFEIATETYAQWMPGRKFQSVTMADEHTISSVSFVAIGGAVRLFVTNTSAAEERLSQDLRSIIQDEVAIFKYAATWEYEIRPNPLNLGLSSALDLKSLDPSMPDLTKVPLASELGVVAPPSAGTKCRVRFVNCDPTRAEVFALGGHSEHLVTIEACSLLIFNVLAAWCAAAGGGPLLAAVLQPLIMPSIILALTTQTAPAPPGFIAQTVASAALAAAMAPGVAPSTTSLPFNSIIALITNKTLNVSGAFPNVGIPSIE